MLFYKKQKKLLETEGVFLEDALQCRKYFESNGM